MNDRHDLLEAELEAMTPAAPSPTVRRSIREAISHDACRTATKNKWLVAAMATAAGLMVAVTAWHALFQAVQVQPPRPHPPIAIAVAPAASLVLYRQAFHDSPQKLEAMLDVQANQPIGASSSGAFRAFDPADRDAIPLK